MSHPILKRHLESRSLRPLYLFYGEEEFLMERALRRLETALAEASGEPVLRVVREAPEVSLEEFLAQARMATLWGETQLLILRRADTYPAEALSAVTDSSPPGPRQPGRPYRPQSQGQRREPRACSPASRKTRLSRFSRLTGC